MQDRLQPLLVRPENIYQTKAFGHFERHWCNNHLRVTAARTSIHKDGKQKTAPTTTRQCNRHNGLTKEHPRCFDRLALFDITLQAFPLISQSVTKRKRRVVELRMGRRVLHWGLTNERTLGDAAVVMWVDYATWEFQQHRVRVCARLREEHETGLAVTARLGKDALQDKIELFIFVYM